MGWTRRSLGALVTSAAMMVAGGCGGEGAGGGGGSASKSEATVTGKVTIKGKAATKGNLTFEPLGANGIPTGSKVTQVGKDGTYTVTTTTGSNDVTISGTGNAVADSSYNKTTLDVTPGANTKDFDLPLPP